MLHGFVVLWCGVARGTSLIGNSVRDFCRTKGFTRNFDGFFLKTKGFFSKGVRDSLGVKCPSWCGVFCGFVVSQGPPRIHEQKIFYVVWCGVFCGFVVSQGPPRIHEQKILYSTTDEIITK